MKTDKPFQKSFTCGGALFAIIILAMAVSGVQIVAYRFGYVLATCLFPSLASGIWCSLSKKTWTWGRFATTVIGLYLLFAFLNLQGKAHR